MKNILTILFLLLISGCKVAWTPADEARCKSGPCYVDFVKESKNYCNGSWTSTDCMNKEDPNTDGGPPKPSDSTGKDPESSSDPCKNASDCPTDLGDPELDQLGKGNGQGGSDSGGGGFMQGAGDTLTHWGNEIGKGWEGVKGEINGSNAEKRRKKREAKRLLSEIRDLWSQADGYVAEVAEDQAAIKSSWGLLEDSWKEFGIASREKDLQEFRGRYNTRTKGILDEVPEADPSVFDGMGKGRGDGVYPEHAKVEQGRKYLKYARGKLDPNATDYSARSTLLDIGDAALDEAESSYRAGNIQEGNFWYDFGVGLADVALSITPVIGWAKDSYEAYTGKSLLTGKPLTRLERTMATVGALTAGVVKIGMLTKAGKIAGFLGDGAKTAEEAEAIAKIGQDAVEITEAAAKAGIKDKAVIDEVAEAVRDGLPCVAMQLEIRSIFDIFIGTAYAGDCIPGSAEKIVKESLGNTKLSSADFEYKLSKLPPGERVAEIKGTLTAKAKEYGWNKDRNITKKNSRDVFKDRDNNLWAIDSLHGRYEKCNPRGKHQGEFRLNLEFVDDSIDKSGGHDLLL